MFNTISFPISNLPEDNAAAVVVYSDIRTRLAQEVPDYTKEIAAFNSDHYWQVSQYHFPATQAFSAGDRFLASSPPIHKLLNNG